jgi:hypothetical protein
MTKAENSIPGRGDFFAVDRRAWASAYNKTGLHGALAYLILARGSLADMRTTSWSAESINQRTRLNWRQAKEAIKCLTTAELIRQDKGGSQPRYFILPVQSETNTEWIWLPNTLADGVDGNPAPIEQVRQSGRPATLRLLVDLYGEQELAGVGGVHWRKLRMLYSRERLGEQGQYVVWGFKRCGYQTWTTTPLVKPYLTGTMVAGEDGQKRDSGLADFWDELKILERISLISFVPHVIEHDHAVGENAAIVHPYGWPVGEQIERDLAIAAHRAGCAMLPEWKRAEIQRTGQVDDLLLVPVPAHILDVQMVGLARLKFRTKSSATAIWASRAAEWEKLVVDFRGMSGEETSVNAEAC